MQALRDGVRADVPEATTLWLLQDAPARRIHRRLELVDRDLNTLDWVDEFAGGSVRRNSYADNHATASLTVGRELDWGGGLVRPSVGISAGSTGPVWFRMGVYWLPTPETSVMREPRQWDIECVDYLDALGSSVGENYALPTGAVILDAVRDILLGQGYTQFIIDPLASDQTVTSPGFTRAFTDNITWRSVVNDLLSMVGYGGVYSDWNGVLRCEPYTRPTDRAAEWTYAGEGSQSMIYPERSIVDDYYGVPNQWTFYINNLEEGQVLSDGSGIYRYTNYTIGRASVEGRGRVIPAQPEGIEATSQASLEAAAQRRIDADMSITRTYAMSVDLNPLHWHFDRVDVEDEGLGHFRAQVTEWTVDFRAGVMPLALTEVDVS